ncbi:DUF4297 domain-containing protein [Herbaspirillum sp. LeCh32-8]|uniref:dsDNA nuclease domain-containing protein n=1 Tax=Herbaspirillum sp. LeCh32-8 TaxID=2821356 RepID=UPI001AE13A7A|nr:dsDNA nuclease domain-containing protein [Herbaspirillum sp. LeCh32-8]MBP0598845.1 DUF4297 domain-containing protein [Herbaspirillum sp. LeCh32-8]
MKAIEATAPGEVVGRDTITRFDMQFQAAAYAALEILEGKGVDCVYCDFHEDFVVQRTINGRAVYHFFQVKTKKRLHQQWTLADIFSLKKSGQKKDQESLEKVKQSFAGKLLVRGIVFTDQCAEVTLLSNVYFNDDVVTAVEELRGKAPVGKAAKFLAENFSAIFELTERDDDFGAETLSKLSLKPAVRYISETRDSFCTEARRTVFDYSEIDLDHYEADELANGLVNMVYEKSKIPLHNVPPEKIPELAGVRINDLLSVLSISKSAYQALLDGEEPKALRSASVIQRWFKKAGCDDEMIAFCAQQKVNWDLWHRTARNVYLHIDLALLLKRLDDVTALWVRAGAEFEELLKLIKALSEEPHVLKFEGLTSDLLFGGINSVLVRSYAK